MAEAHSAVAFQFAVTDDGVLFHVNKTAVLRALWRICLNKYFWLRRSILTGIFPATPRSLLVVTGAIMTLNALAGVDPSLGIIDKILSYLPTFLNLPLPLWTCGLLMVESLALWTGLCFLQRYTLKALLFYKGWMFDVRGQRSWRTKLFGMSVKLVAGTSNPLLGSYQQSLPRLPLPSIKDTCDKYLQSVRPLYNDEEFEEKKRLVDEFKRGPANQLQRYLILKSWLKPNYVTDWWEKYVYWSWRGSVMINSNYYACDHNGVIKNPHQISRASFYLYAIMRMKIDIERETLKPLIINNLIPLCSTQYRRLFGTCRIPGETEDTLFCATPKESRHVVCYSQGHWYKMPLYHKGRMLRPVDIKSQLQQIVDDNTTVSPGEKHLCALTTLERHVWADIRQRFFSKGINKEHMSAIEKAALFLNLDSDSPEVALCGEGKREILNKYCQEMLHGKGYKFWFDKSVSCIVYQNGRVGINAEHSWADAPIVGHMLEYCCNLEEDYSQKDDEIPDPDTPKPQRMNWEISPECQEKIESAYNSAQVAIEDIDLFVNQHDRFGKGIIKKCGISPDAFIQMAIQLAYYREKSKFCLTYESSMTRLYRDGRTETVRPCTNEAAEFVRSMCTESYTKEERKRLLKIATDKHVLSYKNAMIGKGIDRHLFCLYVVSRGKDIHSPFLSSVIQETWKLSTSQTPTQQTGRIDYHANPDKICCGGGFGPVTKDGYGVSYIIPGDYVVYFHVSSFKSSPDTDSKRFSRGIEDSLLDMINLFDIVLKPEDGLQYEYPSSK